MDGSLEGVWAGLDQLYGVGLAHSLISIGNVFVDRENGAVFVVDLEYLFQWSTVF